MAKFTSEDNMTNRELSNINTKLDQILLLEQRETNYYKQQEKYQKYENKNTENEKLIKEKDYKRYNKELKKSEGLWSSLLNWITKMGTILVSYKITEWFADSRNIKKIASILKAFTNIGKFIKNTSDNLSKFLESSKDKFDAVGKTFSTFFDSVNSIIEPITNPINYTTESIKSIPQNITKSFYSLLQGITSNLDKASDSATAEASVTIKDGVNSLAATDNKPKEPLKSSETESIKTPEISTINPPKIDNSKVIDTNINTENIPKLAKGGVVPKPTNTTNNIKPLESLLLGTTDNTNFNSDVKNIAPKFEELMRLPFSIIGSGIVSILKSAIKDNPDSSNTVSPLLNSIGKMFNVPIGDSNNNLKIGKAKSDKTSDNDISKYIGTTEPSITQSSNNNEKFQSSNDTTVRGLLADILNALSSKIAPSKLPEKSMGGDLDASGSGWINGSHQGYPVSLDGGASTSFIGHGTEYVSKHKTNDSSFVIPFDTPATKTNKNLTKTRINEAISRGYDVPKMSDGGAVKSNGWNDNIRLEDVSTIGGLHYSVAKPLANRFKGFVDRLESEGYGVASIGGYNLRPDEKPDVRLGHPYGAAIDINPDQNPMGSKLKTDMPKNISLLAKQFGLGWGGNWKRVKDAMHFSAMKNEGGDGFSGQEIVKGTLAEKNLKKLSDGGMVKANGYNDGIKLENFTTNGGVRYSVAKPLYNRFHGFVQELESSGYKIYDRDGAGYVDSDNSHNLANGKFAHPFGAAIDINPAKNPMQATLKTDMPSNITQMAKKYGLGWGGNWRSKKDSMHFSAMKREGGDGFNGQEIGKGVLADGTIDKFVASKPSKDTPATPSNNNSPVPATPTPASTPAPTPTPEVPDYKKLGGAFSSLAQMLGLGGSDEDKKKKMSTPTPTTPTTPTTPKTTNSPTAKPPTTTPKTIPNTSPTKAPRTKDHITASSNNNSGTTTLIKSGNTNNIADKNVYSASGFDYNSDTHRFLALSSTTGNVTDPIFV